MHQIVPAAPSLVHDEKALGKLSNMVHGQALPCEKQVKQLLNFAALAPPTKGDKMNSSVSDQQQLLNQVLLQQCLLLQQSGIHPSFLFNPFMNGVVAPFKSVQQGEVKADKVAGAGIRGESLKRKLGSTGVESRAKFVKTNSCGEVKSVNTALEAGAPPKKEYRVKGRVYIVQNERKKWDGRQWRRLCVAEDCSCAARGATLYCVNHGKKKFNVNVKHYRRSNIPSGLEGLVKEPKEKKSAMKKFTAVSQPQAQPQLQQQLHTPPPAQLSPALLLQSAQSNVNLMHVLAQAALSTNM